MNEYQEERQKILRELKPCPFCGAEAEIVFSGNPFKGGYIVARCTLCKATVVGGYYRGKEIEIPLEETKGGEKAIAAWNRRLTERGEQP